MEWNPDRAVFRELNRNYTRVDVPEDPSKFRPKLYTFISELSILPGFQGGNDCLPDQFGRGQAGNARRIIGGRHFHQVQPDHP